MNFIALDPFFLEKQIQAILMASLFVMLYTAEHLLPQRKDIIDYKHELYNLFIGLINQLFIFFLAFGLFYALEFSKEKGIGLFHFLEMHIVLNYILALILIDLWMYWWHRMNHRLKVLWYFHRFHHLDTKMNSTTAVRFHTGEVSISMVIQAILFSILGFEVLAVILYQTILFAVILFHHSNLKISKKIDFAFRKFIVSPRMHRIHHSKIIAETNSNYSSVLPLWDLIFKSYTRESPLEVDFGLEENEH